MPPFAAWETFYVIVISHTRRQTLYQPVLEDWLFHCVFPLIAYSTLVVAAATLPRIPTQPLFAIAAASLLLLFSGIHNAWDAVVYIAFTSRDELPSRSRGQTCWPSTEIVATQCGSSSIL